MQIRTSISYAQIEVSILQLHVILESIGGLFRYACTQMQYILPGILCFHENIQQLTCQTIVNNFMFTMSVAERYFYL